MKSYYRIMLGAKSMYAEECFKGGFIGADYNIDIDLTNKLPDDWREFNKKHRPIWMKKMEIKAKWPPVLHAVCCGPLPEGSIKVIL